MQSIVNIQRHRNGTTNNRTRNQRRRLHNFETLESRELLAADSGLVSHGSSAAYSASAGLENVDLAFDGSPGTTWNSRTAGSAWIQVDLGSRHQIDKISLNIAQSPSGRTKHEVWVSNTPMASDTSGARRLTVLDGVTQDGQVLEVAVPTTGRYVQIQTVASPSWVAWREVKVYGSDMKLVSADATYTASSQTATAERAFDGSRGTAWNSRTSGSAWIQVDLGFQHRIDKIALNVAQSPSGHTTHQVWVSDSPMAGNTSNARLLTVFDGHTSHGQVLEASEAVVGRYVQVQTVRSPSWVSWREIDIYGEPAQSDPVSVTGNPALLHVFDAQTDHQTSTARRDWKAVRVPDASGGVAVAVPDIGSSRSAESLDFRVNVTKPGRYYLWVRAKATNGGNNSLHAGINGKVVPSAHYIVLRRGATMHWNGIRKGSIRTYLDFSTAGEHTVSLIMREDGALIDQLLLTPEEEFRPDGIIAPYGMSSGELALSAAQYHGNISSAGRAWQRTSADAIQVPEQHSSTGAPRVDFLVYFPRPGRYLVDVEGRATHGGDNSVNVAFDGSTVSTAAHIQLVADNKWHWNSRQMSKYGGKLAYVDVPEAGIHSVGIHMREDGAEIRKLRIRQDASIAIDRWSDVSLRSEIGDQDLALFTSGGNWLALRDDSRRESLAQFGLPTDQPAIGDFNGDGAWEMAAYRGDPDTGLGWWYVDWDHNGYNGELPSYQFGHKDDQAVTGDFNGDGTWEMAVYRGDPVTGLGWWYIDWDHNGYNGELPSFQFGHKDDQAVAGDFNGDGTWEIAVYRGDPSGLGWWYIDWNHNGYDGEVPAFQFGHKTDQAVVGDFDGDGKSEVAVYRLDHEGQGWWYVDYNNNGYDGELPVRQFGGPFDQAIAVPSSLTLDTPSESVTVWIHGGALSSQTVETFQWDIGREHGDALALHYKSLGDTTLYQYDPTTGDLAILTSDSANPAHKVILFDWRQNADPVDGSPGDDEAASDALVAMLVQHDLLATEDYLHLIGTSRGAVVASEAAQRLVQHRFDVDQVTYIDTEPGCETYEFGAAGDSLAWEGIGFVDNYISEYGSWFGCRLQGHEVDGAHNVVIPDSDHFDADVWYKDTISRDSVGGLSFEGFFWRRNAWLQAARNLTITRPRTSLETPPSLFNGDFEYAHDGYLIDAVAGWYFHGGGGDAKVQQDANGGHYLQLTASADRTHNRAYVSTDARSLSYKVQVPNQSEDYRLTISALLEDGGVLLDALSLSASNDIPYPQERFNGGWQTRTVPVPSQIRGQVVRLLFSVSPAREGLTPRNSNVQVHVDDIAFGNDTATSLDIETLSNDDRLVIDRDGASIVVNQRTFLGDNVQRRYPANEVPLLRYFGTGAVDDVVNNTATPLHAWTGNGNDTVKGGFGDDFLAVGAGEDTLDGRDGNDTLWGYLGNDNYVFDGLPTGTKSIWDVEDVNSLDFRELDTRVTVDIGRDSLQQVTSDGLFLDLYNEAAVDHVRGTPFDDVLVGNDLDNELDGGLGNDQLDGRNGNDRLWGYFGNDTYAFRNRPRGNKTIWDLEHVNTLDFQRLGTAVNVDIGRGGWQQVTSDGLTLGLLSDRAVDHVRGTPFDDVLLGNNLNNELDGGHGNDRLDGRNGNDRLWGHFGYDTYVFGGRPTGTKSIWDLEEENTLDFQAMGTGVTVDIGRGGAQQVTPDGLHLSLLSNEAVDHVLGTQYADDLRGNALKNTLNGFGGNDFISGRKHHDLLIGGSGNDELYGGNGNDEIRGDAGNDYLHDGWGHDRLYGGTGVDRIGAFGGTDIISTLGQGVVTAFGNNDRVDGVYAHLSPYFYSTQVPALTSPEEVASWLADLVGQLQNPIVVFASPSESWSTIASYSP